MKKLVFIICGYLFLIHVNLASANFLVFSGATYRAMENFFTFKTPNGQSFNTMALYRLDYLNISDTDSIAYDFSSNTFHIYQSITPYELLTSHDDFKPYNVDTDVAIYDENTMLFNVGSTIEQINYVGTFLYVGPIRYGELLDFEAEPVTFDYTAYDLTINIGGSGNIELSPAGDTYEAGTVVILTATADPGWMFSDWGGDLHGSNNPATIIMDSNKNIAATFLEDSDNDGMPDKWEEQYGTNPSVKDASDDPDNDGFSNFEEYEFHTDPKNPYSHPSKAMPWIPLLLLDD